MARTTTPTSTRQSNVGGTSAQSVSTTRPPEKSTAKKAAEAAKSTAYETADQLTSQASRLADDAISTGRAQADQYVRQGVGRTEALMRSVGRAIEAGSNSLEQDGMAATAGYVRAAANGLQRAADEVDGFEPGTVTGRVEGFVRQQPLLTMGALALVGFAIAGSMQKRRS